MSGLHGRASDLAYEVGGRGASRQTILEIDGLDLQPGKLTVLSGPSGSGKSTLLYLLSGLLLPARGIVSWNGEMLSEQSETARDRWRLEHAGFVFQAFNLVDELSPLENVLLPTRFSRNANGLRQRAGGLLAQFGVPVERSSAALLSRGEQQRVALARALLLEPEVIFADEPTASLDTTAGETVARILKDLAADQGRTVIVASHDPAVLALADHTVRLDHGRRVTAERLAA